MADRLQEVLVLLDYGNAKQPHYRSNLIHAIQMFAGLRGDAELEAACGQEIARIQAEVTTSHTRTDDAAYGGVSRPPM